jgi:phage-related protein
MPKVVQIARPPYLRIKQLAAADGVGVITKWLLPFPAARAKFRIRVENLAQIPRAEWNIKQFRPLGGGIFEIKWEADKPFRALGFDRDGYFVMVIGCTHKQNVYEPTNCLTTANNRMKEAKNGYWNIIAYDLLPPRKTD